MPVSVLVGMQWGDEGKGKIVDLLSEKHDIIARYQGGANAGHTVVIDGKQFILHIVPSGILRPGKICLIGSGVVLDPEAFLSEIDQLKESGIDVEKRVLISPRAHCILPVHKELDKANESFKAQKKIGTTGRGIGPSYSDKAQRIGVPMFYLQDEMKLKYGIAALMEIKNSLLKNYYMQKTLDAAAIIEQVKSYIPKISPFIGDTRAPLMKAISENKKILCEGAQGTMLDLDHGTYPFVTSSNTISAGACIGLGIPPNKIDKIIGIVKAYTTRVGEGPFPTELSGSIGKILQDDGAEFGATTGRPRRCGWFDAVVAKYAVEINGINEVVLTKLDVLDNLKTINVCTAYDVDGGKMDRIDGNVQNLEKAKPVYTELQGWMSVTAGTTSFDKLPDNAKLYVDFLRKEMGAPISIISTGPDRNSTIFL